MPGYNNALNNTILAIAGFGTATPADTTQVAVTPSINTIGVTTGMLVNPTFASSATVYGQIISPAFNPPAAGQHSADYGLSIAPTLGAGTISTAYGVKISGISAVSNTITNATGLYVTNASGAGSILNKYTAILGTDQNALVGIGDISPMFMVSAAGAVSAQQVIGATLGTTDNNQLINLAEGYDQGGLGGGSVGTNKQMSVNTATVFDITQIATSDSSYIGGAFDGRYIYLAPHESVTVTRYDTTLPFANVSSYTVFDITRLSFVAGGYLGATFDGRYVYFVPYVNSIMMRYDTHQTFNSVSSFTTFDVTLAGCSTSPLFEGGGFDGRYIYFDSRNSSQILRYDTTASFTSVGSYSLFDTTPISSNGQFQGITFDGRYIYFAPSRNSGAAIVCTTVIRYDTTLSFNSVNSYEGFDLSTSISITGFSAPVFDGRYVYFPALKSYSTIIARYDSWGDFQTASSYTSFDALTIDPLNNGFVNALYDGRYVYFVANATAQIRYDTTQSFNLVSSYTTFNTRTIRSQSTNFYGALFDGRYAYLVGDYLTRLDAYPGPQATALAANQAPNGFVIGSYAGTTVAPLNSLLVSGNMGINTSDPQYTLDVNGTIRAAIIYGTIDTTLGIHALTTNNQTINVAEGYSQGGMGGGIVGLNKTMSANTTAFLDTTAVSSGSQSFRGALFDGIYVYFVPGSINSVPSGTVTRYNTQQSFTLTSSCVCFDLKQVDPGCVNFWGALYDERYVYFVPDNAGSSGLVARYDTTQLFNVTSSYTVFDMTSVSTYCKGFAGGVFDGRYLYFSPNNVGGINSGTVARYDTESPFTLASSYTCFDLSRIDSRNKGFIGAAFDGRYVYFVPNNSNTSGVVAQYDTSLSFNAAGSYAIFDMTPIHTTCIGFYSGIFDGRYVYFVPNNNGTSGLIVRYDTTQPFTSILAYQTFDVAALDAASLGFAGAAFDNRYVYFIPGLPGYGTVARYDTTLSFVEADSYAFLGTAGINSNSTQFMGAAYDGRYLFLAPAANGQITRLDAYPGPQATAMAANQAPNGFQVGTFAGTGTPNNTAYTNALLVGGHMGVNTQYPANELEVVGTVSATNLLINNFLPLHGTYNNQLTALSQGYNQGGMGGGSVGTNKTMSVNATTLFDLARVDSRSDHFYGAVFDGRFIYYVPWGHGVVFRYDTIAPVDAPSSYGMFDLTTVYTNSYGFQRAVFDGRYIYYVPARNTGEIPGVFNSGTITRYDTNNDFYTASSYSVFDTKALSPTSAGFEGAIFDGRYVYYMPALNRSTVVRYDTTLPFVAAASYSTFNLLLLSPFAMSYTGGVYDGRYVYFVPTNTYVFIRYDTTKSFSNAGSYEAIFISTTGNRGAVFDSRYVYLIPNNTGTNGTILRFDTQLPFLSPTSYASFDMSLISPGALGYEGGVFDGRYIYFAPRQNYGDFFVGTIARFDTTMPFDSTSSYSFFDASDIDSRCKGFIGAIFDGSYVYFVPDQHSVVVRIDAYPGPLATSMVANQAPNGFVVGSYIGESVAPDGGLIVRGQVGVATSSPTYTLDVNGTLHASVLIDESSEELLGATTNNQLITLAQGYNQGGFGSGYVGTNKQMSLNSATTFNLQTFDSHAQEFRGAAFDGRFIYLSPLGVTVVRYDTTLPISSVNSYTLFDIARVNPTTNRFLGNVYDGRYIYFVPTITGNGTIVRYDTTQLFNLTTSYAAFDVRAKVNSNCDAMQGALFDGRYVYFPTGITTIKTVLRFDTTLGFTTASSYTTIDLSAYSFPRQVAGTYDGRYLYFAATNLFINLRYDSAGSFTLISNWTTFDLSSVNGDSISRNCFDGRYIYYAPCTNATVTRYDTQQSFTNSNSYDTFSISQSLSNSSASIYLGCVYDGRYVYFVPTGSTPAQGWVARYDATRLFTSAGSWTLLNLAAMNTNCTGFQGGIFDGRYVYFIPNLGTGSQFTRIDAYVGQQANALAASGAPNGFAIGSYAGTAVPPADTLIISGNVGIRTPTPTFSLQIQTGDAAKPLGGNWDNTSDVRVKQNIEDISDALSTICQLHPCKFTYHPDYAKDIDVDVNQTFYGFIADEVEKVLEGCVKPTNIHCYGGKLKNWFGDSGSLPEPISGMENLKTFDMHNILVYGIQASKELIEKMKILEEELDNKINN
jgi:hypothetical protein